MQLSLRHAVALALALSCATQSPAHASSDGALCDGAGILGCGPRLIGMSIAEKMRAKSPTEKVQAAVSAGDLAQIQRFKSKEDEAYKPEKMLPLAVRSYLTGMGSDKDAKRLAVIEYLAAKTDIAGALGGSLLQETVYQAAFVHIAPEKSWPRRLALARLLIDRGASAEGVKLSGCFQCENDNGYLQLLIEHGAIGRPGIVPAAAEKAAEGQSNLLK